jgi:hypothetical protein
VFYESFALRIEWFMGSYHVTMRARSHLSTGTYDWDDLYSGTFTCPDLQDPLDEVYLALEQIQSDMLSEHRLQAVNSPQPED